MQKVEFYKHNIGNDEIEEVTRVLKSTILTTGSKNSLVEELIADYLGVKGVALTSSWTAGAFLSLKAWGIGPGDEVILPALSFVASSNVVLHCGAKVVFCDVDEDTGLMTDSHVRDLITENTKAIMPVHLYGQMCDMKTLKFLTKGTSIRLFEDSAHGMECARDAIKPGKLSDAAGFSFYATKTISCGEGGAIVSSNLDFIDSIKRLRLHGMTKSASERYHKPFRLWDMTELGYKFNLPDILACLLIPQLKKIEESRQRRQEIYEYYADRFTEADIPFPKHLDKVVHSHHLFTVWAPAERRDHFLKALQDKGIGVAVNFPPIHLTEYYRKTFSYKEGDFPVSEKIGAQTLSIPIYPRLSEEERNYVADSVIEVFQG